MTKDFIDTHEKGYVAFARTGGDKTELRGLVDTALAQALDALAHADGQDRNAYVVGILSKHVSQEVHKTIMRQRMLRGNPLFADAAGTLLESGA